MPTGMKSTVQAAIVSVESGKKVARMSTLSVNVGADGGHKKQLSELSKQLKLPHSTGSRAPNGVAHSAI